MALALLASGWHHRRRWRIVAGAACIAYAFYESTLQRRAPGANIRVDLLLMFPVLLALSVAGLWHRRRR